MTGLFRYKVLPSLLDYIYKTSSLTLTREMAVFKRDKRYIFKGRLSAKTSPHCAVYVIRDDQQSLTHGQYGKIKEVKNNH